MPCTDCICQCVKNQKKKLLKEGKKECKNCNIIKPVEEFDNHRAKCKGCRRTRNLNYYNKKVKTKNTVSKKQKLLQQLIDDKDFDDMKDILMEKIKKLIESS